MFQIQCLLRVGPTLAGGAEPDPARARPSPLYFRITGPSPTWSVMFQSHAASARPGDRVPNLTGHLPGLAREIHRILSLFLRAVYPPPRGFEVATWSLARIQRLLFGDSLAVYNRHTKQSLPCPYTGVRIPLVPHGLRSALIRHRSRKARKIMSWFVIFFVESWYPLGELIWVWLFCNARYSIHSTSTKTLYDLAYVCLLSHFYHICTLSISYINLPCSPSLALGPAFFRRRPRGLLCGAGVARSCGRGRSRGARESRPKTRRSKTGSNVKIQSETTFISSARIM